MQMRYMLRRHLVNAWHETVRTAYVDRLINSERGLQHFFCTNLLAQFAEDGVGRRIFVEPSFTCPASGQKRSPDVVVCHSRQIIAAIELKYVPRGQPATAKDLDTLQWLAGVHEQVRLSNERYLGAAERAAPSYTVAEDAVLCWGGIYKAPELPVGLAKTAGKRFLALHALTSAGRDPEVFPTERK
jgi:hypothetical protein